MPNQPPGPSDPHSSTGTGTLHDHDIMGAGLGFCSTYDSCFEHTDASSMQKTHMRAWCHVTSSAEHVARLQNAAVLDDAHTRMHLAC